VLLVSTRAGGVGLSLTAASRVYMMDLWWNAAVDQQVREEEERGE
jgi:SNF2 family DNA or RNA helicase